MNKRFELLEKYSARIIELGTLIDEGQRKIEKVGLCEYKVELNATLNNNKITLKNKVFAFSPEQAYRRSKGKAITDYIKWEEENAQR